MEGGQWLRNSITMVGAKMQSPAFGVTPSRRSWVFAAALSTIFMAAMEGTIVATAMPTIVGSLGGFDLFSWVFSAYLLAQATTIPIYGRLADIYGRKRIVFLGIGLFLAGSVLCGFAWNMISLIAFRILQGIGSGALIPVAQTIVGDLYSGEDRARMQGYVSSVFGSAAILGPTIGSLLVAHVHWSMVFWINVPLGIIAGVMLAVTFNEQAQKRPHRIDYLGSALMVLGSATFMFALVQAPSFSISVIIGLIGISLALLAVLFIYERRTPEPMLPLELFRIRVIAVGNVVGLANGAMMMGIVAFLPAYMLGALQSSTSIAALALAAMAGAWPVGGLIGSRIILLSSYRVAGTIGSLVLLAGSLAMIALDPILGPAWPIAGALLVGFGIGVTNICFVIAVQAAVDKNQRGTATASLSFTRILGQSLGTAIFGGIFNIGLSGHILGGTDIVVQMMQPNLRAAITVTEIKAAVEAFTQSLHNVYLVNGLLALVVLAAVRSLPAGLKLVR